MASQTAKTRRKPRADSLRNRQKLLEAASVVFGAGDGQAARAAASSPNGRKYTVSSKTTGRP